MGKHALQRGHLGGVKTRGRACSGVLGWLCGWLRCAECVSVCRSSDTTLDGHEVDWCVHFSTGASGVWLPCLRGSMWRFLDYRRARSSITGVLEGHG